MELEPVNNFIDAKIYTVRGESVMLDSDLAEVYQVETKALNQAVKRNEAKFPPEFSFQLTQNEWDALRSQIVTSNTGRGGRRYPPRVFTENGAVALAMALDSERAVAASIQVIKAFVRLRHLLTSNAALARRMDELEAKYTKHDRTITVIFHELKKLVGGDAHRRARAVERPHWLPDIERQAGVRGEGTEGEEEDIALCQTRTPAPHCLHLAFAME